MSRRPVAASVLALGLLLTLIAPALAGGWAEVRADAAATTEPPRVGQPVVIGFTVLQHGETPAGWVTPTVRFTSLTGGTGVTVAAERSGADGHFSATFTPDAAGYWSWVVSFPELLSDEVPMTLAVADASGVVPAFDPGQALAAMERVRTTVSTEILDRLEPRLQLIDGQLAQQRATNALLTSRIGELTAERDALVAEGEAALTPGLLAGVVVVAVLAGATAGFEPEPSLSPASPGSTPARAARAAAARSAPPDRRAAPRPSSVGGVPRRRRRRRRTSATADAR